MTRVRFTNGRVVAADAVLDGACIELDGDRIAAIAPLDGPGADAIDLDGGWIVPGFIDTQVNGGGGVLFNDLPTVEGIRAIGAAHLPFGTTGFLPTLISDTLAQVEAALDATEAAIEAGVPGVLGAHIEGPFLNPARKGIHDPAHFRRIDAATIELLTRPRRGRVMLTLAPELCAPEEIAALAAGGVLVSGGHSEADYAQVRAALDAGLRGFTHLFNAMSPLGHRAPGMVGAALEDREAWCGLIVDGAHVDPAALRIALAARPADRMMLVTDAMPSVGAVSKDFALQGRPIRVEGGVCLGADGTLAGSDLDMAQAFRNTVQMLHRSPVEAAALAASNPAAFLRLEGERGRLAPGLRADWVRLDSDLRPRGTWIGGVQRSPGA